MRNYQNLEAKLKKRSSSNRLRIRTQNQKRLALWAGVFALSVIVLGGVMSFSQAFAYTSEDLNNVNAKISELQATINDYENQANALHEQADSLQNQIAILQNEQKQLKTQIDLKQAEHDKIVIDIESTQKRIDDNNEAIGYAIAQYYYSEESSTIERLASSANFSAFLDQEVNLSNISDTLMEIVKENERLKADLVDKKTKAEQILADLNSQKEELVRKEQEQAALLAQTQSDEAKYKDMKAKSENEKAELRRQQQEIIAALAPAGSTPVAGDASKGGYPYSGECPAHQDWYSDPWGMYICECVSYAAWKVQQNYGNMPYWGGRGNANQWPANARSMGITVSDTPKAGTVGIMMSGYYGHAVWVEAVSNDGSQVYISQYNYLVNGVWGEYSEMWMPTSAFVYIYFGG